MTINRPFGQFITAGHFANVLAFLVASCALIIGVRFGTLAIGGSDSTCAIMQARMLFEGQRSIPSPLPDQRFPADLSAMLAPPGFVGLADGSDQAVPGCPAGLSVAMAAALRVGGDPALFLAVPLFGMLAIWSTYHLARTLVNPWAGVAAASLLVCSPLFMYGVTQPASDVPAAALWLACLAAAARSGDGTEAFRFRRAVGTGLLVGLATLVRPHLFPLAAVPIVFVTGRWPLDRGNQPGYAVSRSRILVAVLMGMLPGIAAMAWLQWRIYGWPFGSAAAPGERFHGLAQLAANAGALPWWIGVLHTPVLLLAVVAPFWRNDPSVEAPTGDAPLRSAPAPRRVTLLLLGFALAVWALELPFGTVASWQDAGSMIPALPVAIVLTIVALWSPASRRRSRWHLVALLAMVAMIGGWWIQSANQHGIFRAKAIDRKYREAGLYAADKLPPESVVLAVLPGGSLRYYAGTPTLTWTAIPADNLDRVLDELRGRGFNPFIVLDASERESFKTRFGRQSAIANLDWTARATIGRDISFYDPADRTRFLAGERIPTELISWPR